MRLQLKKGTMLGALLMTASAFVVKILGFIYKIPLSYYLGDEGMGYYNTALTIYAVFYILSASAIPKAFSLVLMRAREYHTKDGYQKTVFAFCSLFSVIGLFFSFLLFYCANGISTLLGVSRAVNAIRRIAPAVGFASLGALCRGYLLSYNKLVPVAVSEATEALLKLLCGLFFLLKYKKAGASLEDISAYATSGITMGALISLIFLLVCILFKEREAQDYGVLSFSLPVFASSTAKIIFPLTLTSLISSFSGVLELSFINRGLASSGVSYENAVAQYGNYTTLVLPLFAFVSAIAGAFCLAQFPRLTQAYEQKRINTFARIVEDAVPTVFFVSLMVALGFYFYGEDYFRIFFSKNDIRQGVVLLKIMSPSVIFITLTTLLNTALEAAGNTFAPLLSLGTGTLIKMPLCILLIHRYGIYGSAFASVIAYALALLLSYIIYMKKTGHFGLQLKTVFQGIFISLVSFGISLTLKNALVKYKAPDIVRMLPVIVCALFYLFFMRLFAKKNATVLTFSTK